MSDAPRQTAPARPGAGAPAASRLTPLSALLVALGAAGLVLLSPLPSPEEAVDLCMQSRHIAGSPFGFPLNCDSALFVQAGLEPSQVLAPDFPFRSRPLYFAVPAVAGLTGDAAVVFQTYQAMNVAFLALAVWLFGRLVDGPRRTWMLLLPLIVLNDIVKAFVWTPHTQILNLAMPLLGLWLLRELSPGRSLRWYVGLGTAVGLAILVYPAAIPLVAAVPALMMWQRGGYRVRQGATFAVTAFLPVVAWMLAATAMSSEGAFSTHEVATHRQIVWLADLDLRHMALSTRVWFVQMAAVIVAPALIAAAGLWCARRQGWRPSPDLVRAALVVTVAIAGFTWTLGFAPSRLTWAVVAPVLVVAATALSSVDLPRRQAVAFSAAVAGWTIWQVVSPGPWA